MRAATNFRAGRGQLHRFGMPREAILHGAADEILPLQEIAAALLNKLASSTDRYRI